MSHPPARTIATVNLGDRVIDLIEGLGRIDLDDLRTEVQTVGEVALWWGDFAARARRRAGEAKLALEVLRAELGKAKRLELTQKGERITEGMITELVTLDPQYKQAYSFLLQSEEDANKVESAKFSIARKQSTVEALVPLLFKEEATRFPPEPAGFPLLPSAPTAPVSRTRTPVAPRT